ncbi:hypothetical protein RI129_011664 [Pyrocoelia pectoralis]|uniref:Mitochondrial cardiolipin hydrolase n=1 Tax=Pyrocoelia pectoralis TaxID=417401 RepID=A0AAN7ZDM5_9COLE
MYFKIIMCIIPATPLVLWGLVKRHYVKFDRFKAIDKYLYECKFFSVEKSGCRTHLYRSVSCSHKCAVYDVLYIADMMRVAKYSLNMCMCILTNEAILESLIFLHNNGVKVRVIMDRGMAFHEKRKAMRLKCKGILVKVQKSWDEIMHHKFCYFDIEEPGRCRLFFGSLNLTLQGVTSNWEYLIFTNNLYMINEHKKIFESLWRETELF